MSKLDKVQKVVHKGKVHELVKLTQDKEEEIRMAAVSGLGEVGGDDGFNALIALLESEDEEIKIAAVKALAIVNNDHAETHLRYLMEHDSNPKIQEAIRKSLSILSKSSH
ncbi:HEAT repeat protein [Catenibacillus scindens]|uniref:HEAT repeat protein n=1 Tax=Catenibacillus scindens TaxID=673271 RepID=A0A7W8M6V0_9FIRM|nr:HEAT repeat domain-containing protein [Catenibacillus scindens]MBB5265972.1 HEAT repeat protein [Catenibacillus scindens]